MTARLRCGAPATWALLASGADPTIPHNDGTTPTPMATARQQQAPLSNGVTAEGRRECVAALEVRFDLSAPPLHHIELAEAWDLLS
jgi:ankyrin repeat protein